MNKPAQTEIPRLASYGRGPDSKADASRNSAGADLAAEVAREFGEVRLNVTGTSMLPSLWPEDTVVVQQVRGEGMRRGDLLQFLRHGLLITHRVVSHGTNRLITQGDCVPHPDAPVSEDEIVGRVISVIRNGRTVDPSFTTRRRVAAWALRRSELLRRVVLRVGRGRRA